MIRKKLKIVLDFDDVLASCNEHAIAMHMRETGEILDFNAIYDWGVLEENVDARLQYFGWEEFYQTQPAIAGASDLLMQLMKKADVFICTAVDPHFMGTRIQRILELFPFFPQENILMGQRKDLVHADIMLDDGIHNLEAANAVLPVLFRRPWNRHICGMPSVRNYAEFLALVDTISGDIRSITLVPKIICILGPSGSGKNDAANEIGSWTGFERVKTYSNCRSNKEYIHLHEGILREEDHFFEQSYYCGSCYASSRESVGRCLERGHNAVLVMDVNGCMAMRAAYPGRVIICYKKAHKKDCIRNTLTKRGLTMAQLTERIYNIDIEEKNEVLSDLIIEDDCSVLKKYL